MGPIGHIPSILGDRPDLRVEVATATALMLPQFSLKDAVPVDNWR